MLSMLKFASFLTDYDWPIPTTARSSDRNLFVDILSRLHTYDMRKRLNYEQALGRHVEGDGGVELTRMRRRGNATRMKPFPLQHIYITGAPAAI